MWNAWCAVNSPQFTAITIAFGFLVAGIGVLCLIYIWAYFNKGSAAQQYSLAHSAMTQQPARAAIPMQNHGYVQHDQYGAGHYQYAGAPGAQAQQYAAPVYYAASPQYAPQQYAPQQYAPQQYAPQQYAGYGYYATQQSGVPAVFGRPRSESEESGPGMLEAANNSAYWR